MVKPRSKQATTNQKKDIDLDAVEKLADKMADKPYGKAISENASDTPDSHVELERITISIPQVMSYTLDDIARERKRNKLPNRTVSAIVREALELYLDKK